MTYITGRMSEFYRLGRWKAQRRDSWSGRKENNTIRRKRLFRIARLTFMPEREFTSLVVTSDYSIHFECAAFSIGIRLYHKVNLIIYLNM